MEHKTSLLLSMILISILSSRAAAAPLPTERPRKAGTELTVQISDKINMVFCWVPPGEAQLGSSNQERTAIMDHFNDKKEYEWMKQESSKSRGKFKTDGYWVGKYEVTQDQWLSQMGEKGEWIYFRLKKDGFEAVRGLELGNFPVENVTFAEVEQFIAKLNTLKHVQKAFPTPITFALPNDDQWEYAARGGALDWYYWGNSLNGSEANCRGDYPFGTKDKGASLKRPVSVGSYSKISPHPWGLCDVIGNVREMCSSSYIDSDSKRDPDRLRLVNRGGSWSDPAFTCRLAFRGKEDSETRHIDLGFRIICLPRN